MGAQLRIPNVAGRRDICGARVNLACLLHGVSSLAYGALSGPEIRAPAHYLAGQVDQRTAGALAGDELGRILHQPGEGLTADGSAGTHGDHVADGEGKGPSRWSWC